MLRLLPPYCAQVYNRVWPHRVSLSKRRSILSSLFGFGLMMAGGIAAQAAETIYATYGSLETDLSVAELQSFAETGEKSPKIAYYHALLGDEALAQIRVALTNKVEFPAPVLARFLSTPSGYQVLESLTDVVQARSEKIDSVIALRTALILAASDQESLTVMNLLRLFPDAGVELNFAEGLRMLGQLQASAQTHKDAIASLKQQSQETGLPTEDFGTKYSAMGPLPWKKRVLNLTDERPVRIQATGRSRSFPLELYVPQSDSPMPIVILSHGLGEGLSAFRYFAEHLASHGYLVAVPEHPGSSVSHWRELLESQTDVIANPEEFIDRPLDIQYLLDVLTEHNQTDPDLKGRLNLDQVGLFGHSYGGYTALAAAGADINFDALKEICEKDIVETFNPSLLLQCQAQAFNDPLPNLSDPRIKAVFAAQPIVGSLVGKQSLSPVQVPVVLVSGGADLIAPLVPEQMNPYGTLTAPDRYLILLEKANHYSMIGEIAPQEELFEFSTGGSSRINFKSRKALKSLGLSFFQTHLTGQSEDSFMALVRSLNDPSFPIYGVTTPRQSIAKVQDDYP